MSGWQPNASQEPALNSLVEGASPAAAIVAKAEVDILLRLTPEGLPSHPGNDYELHLAARRLRKTGMGRGEIAARISGLGLGHIPISKRERYIGDILRSVIVNG